MAIEFGYTGGCTLPATVSGLNNDNIYEWTADVSRDVHEADDWNDALNAVVHLGGAYDLKGSCKAWFHGLSPVLDDFQTIAGTPTAAFHLIRNTTGPINYKFTGIVSAFVELFTRQGMIAVEVQFESSGEVSVDTA